MALIEAVLILSKDPALCIIDSYIQLDAAVNDLKSPFEKMMNVATAAALDVAKAVAVVAVLILSEDPALCIIDSYVQLEAAVNDLKGAVEKMINVATAAALDVAKAVIVVAVLILSKDIDFCIIDSYIQLEAAVNDLKGAVEKKEEEAEALEVNNNIVEKF